MVEGPGVGGHDVPQEGGPAPPGGGHHRSHRLTSGLHHVIFHSLAINGLEARHVLCQQSALLANHGVESLLTY